MAKYILSAFADEYDASFSEQLKALNGYGINYIELRGVDGKNISTLSRDEVKSVKAQLKAHGIKVSAIGSPLGKIKLDGDIKEHIETAKRVYEIANELETENIRIFSFYPAQGKNINESKNEVFDAMDKLVQASIPYGVTLCHENEAGIYGESAKNCLEVIEQFHGKLKAIFDMGNFTLFGHDPLDAYETLKPHIKYFHIKDALRAGAIVPPGKGEAKIYEILASYEKTMESDVIITLEPHLQTFSGLNALTDVKFDNPYKYETPRLAFSDAVEKIKEIMNRL
ncbi:MAG: sugar phosphate isomerase/epimerase [Clostridia bacterium]|nr:sugar phosphate isomerase/epimerase [Clostridia bacterium]